MKPLDLQAPPDADRRERDPREPFQPPAEKEPETIEEPEDDPGHDEPARRDPNPAGPPMEVSA